eukprot:2856867-Rhodomonas_salina.2
MEKGGSMLKRLHSGFRLIPIWVYLLAGVLLLVQLYGSSHIDAKPMCDPSGKCHEAPDSPSPRTVHSASGKEMKHWTKFHAHLVHSANGFQAAGKPPVIFLGDSITESWLGTSGGIESARTNGVPAVLDQVRNPFYLARRDNVASSDIADGGSGQRQPGLLP